MTTTSYSNPIWYRGYRIYSGSFAAYEFVHDDYDGAPDSFDNRAGCAPSLAGCRDEIDEMEGESTP